MRRRLLAIGALVAAAAAVVAFARPQSPRPGAGVARANPSASPARPARKRRWHLPAAPADVRGAAARRMKVPILMYHVVSAPPPGAANAELWVDKDVFAAEMQGLRRAGYHAVTLRQAFDAWQDGGPLPRRPVVVSFDDGYLSDYTHARPVLRRLQWPGVLNLEVNNLGKDGITEHQVRSLIANGWEIDSHTLTHPDLTTVGDAQLREELVGSRREIRKRFGSHTAEFFCYPAGKYDARVVAAVRAAGYRGATTVDEGPAARGDSFTLKRVRVNGSDTPGTLLSRLSGV
ncbi:polysaccharide deacetylase family protein [Candidatus Solirubrobacter pratensis]|uniref:polysaccharide deacetylase family protein n=1 Tax=Candidatus Solirubrobacter pratensis TaxID=1298857 RepID=UPI0012DD53C6|nr:polysaccharide deacetylase family protein [Candidatus Solirubrobacter pratensis]